MMAEDDLDVSPTCLDVIATTDQSRVQENITQSNSSYFYQWDRSSCPCCFISGGNKNFLPSVLLQRYNDDKDDDDDENRCRLVSNPDKAWLKILNNDNVDDCVKEQFNVIVDTHCHAHLEGNSQYDLNDSCDGQIPEKNIMVLTCAVSPLNWTDTLDYAANHRNVLPALGIHPWYIPDILSDQSLTNTTNYVDTIGDELIQKLEELLIHHPSAFVGEIGLCRMAKYVRSSFELGGKKGALDLQKHIFKRQFQLAAKYRRPVTVHCVKMHAALISILTDIRNDVWSKKGNMRLAFPPTIALHSFTGSQIHVQELLKFEQSLWLKGPHELQAHKRKEHQLTQQHQNGEPILFYFGFSHCINYLMCSSDKSQEKGFEALQEVPHNRLLAESDVHSTNDVSIGTAGAIAYIHYALSKNKNKKFANLTFIDVAKLTTTNGIHFLKSISQ